MKYLYQLTILNKYKSAPSTPRQILIFYATNRKAVPLPVVVPVDFRITVIQPPSPRTDTIDPCRRPKGSVVTHSVVNTITVVTVTSGKSIKYTCTKFAVIL